VARITERFRARGSNGRLYTVTAWAREKDVSSRDGRASVVVGATLQTEDGEIVTPSSGGHYEIVGTGIILERIADG
jgi:hypothetical protein